MWGDSEQVNAIPTKRIDEISGPKDPSNKDKRNSTSNLFSILSPFSRPKQANDAPSTEKSSSFWKQNHMKVPGNILQTGGAKPSETKSDTKAEEDTIEDVEVTPTPHANERESSPTTSSSNLSHSSDQPTTSNGTKNDDHKEYAVPQPPPQQNGKNSKEKKLYKLLNDSIIDLSELQKITWSGIPDPSCRPLAWKLLLGYLPTNRERRKEALERKRKEYYDCVEQYFGQNSPERNEEEKTLLRQIKLDIPRTNPTVSLFQNPAVQSAMERMLYVWGLRHPASSYVQGMNDLLSVFYLVYLSEFIEGDTAKVCEMANLETFSPALLRDVEADSYWALTKFLDRIHDNYTPSQPGIQRLLWKMKETVRRLDEELGAHLQEQACDYTLFAFRWMNVLLMRELPLSNIIRIWDTYLSEGQDFAQFHIYVCVALLLTWKDKLKCMDFPSAMLFLQALPTSSWTDKEVEMLLSQAFVYQTLFQSSPSHLKS